MEDKKQLFLNDNLIPVLRKFVDFTDKGEECKPEDWSNMLQELYDSLTTDGSNVQ